MNSPVTPESSLDTAMRHLSQCERCDASIPALKLCTGGSALFKAWEILAGVVSAHVEIDRQTSMDSQ